MFRRQRMSGWKNLWSSIKMRKYYWRPYMQMSCWLHSREWRMSGHRWMLARCLPMCEILHKMSESYRILYLWMSWRIFTWRKYPKWMSGSWWMRKRWSLRFRCRLFQLPRSGLLTPLLQLQRFRCKFSEIRFFTYLPWMKFFKIWLKLLKFDSLHDCILQSKSGIFIIFIENHWVVIFQLYNYHFTQKNP